MVGEAGENALCIMGGWQFGGFGGVFGVELIMPSSSGVLLQAGFQAGFWAGFWAGFRGGF
jgi:hypothetical protein